MLLVTIAWGGVVRAEEKITFALFTREWPPFEMVTDGQPRGAAVDLFLAVMPEEVTSSVEMMPAPRSVLHKPGKPVYARLECRDWMASPSGYLWTDTVITVKSVLYSPSGKPLRYKGLSSLHGKTIGCVKNYTYPEVQPLFDSGKAVRYDVNDDLLLLRMVAAARVDVAIFDDVSAAWMIRQSSTLRSEDYHVSAMPLGSSELRFVFNKDEDWAKLIPRINKKIHEKQADGTLAGIMARYR